MKIVKPFIQANLLLLLITAGMNSTYAAFVPDPKSRIEFWYSNYTTIAESENSQVKSAQQIFNKLLSAAGLRPGITPRLHIIKENPYGISLPISIPDGWVIVSQQVLDFCYSDKNKGDDRLAFVLAHEISHHLEDDFWHMKFFQAMGSVEATKYNDQVTLQQLKQIAKDSNTILAKELRADERGIIYSMMAGFDVNAIVAEYSNDNFFTEWNNFYHPNRLKNQKISSTHPSVKQRVAAVQTRLAQVASNAKLFDLGLWYYQSGDFQAAVLAFEEFLSYYSGREVHHNLAVSYHQLASQYYRNKNYRNKNSRNKKMGKHEIDLPFQLSLLIDPIANASRNADRSMGGVTELFVHNSNEAIKNYQIAIALDPSYVPAYNNLASIYLLNNKPYKAIASLQDAEKISPDNMVLLNTLGVAYYQANNSELAQKYIRRAAKDNPAYLAPRYNLGLIAHRQGNIDTATVMFTAYLKVDAVSEWARRAAKLLDRSINMRPQITKNSREKIQGVEIGTYREEIPKKWGSSSTKTFELGDLSHVINEYENIIALYDGDEIRNIITRKHYAGKSAKGIAVGSDAANVLIKYGQPDSVYWTTQGKSLSYLDSGISFITAKNKVSGWILF